MKTKTKAREVRERMIIDQPLGGSSLHWAVDCGYSFAGQFMSDRRGRHRGVAYSNEDGLAAFVYQTHTGTIVVMVQDNAQTPTRSRKGGKRGMHGR